MPKSVPDSCEDLAYTKQFFTITRKGHTNPTAEFGSPTLVWHIAFWPRSANDPYAFQMDAESGTIKNDTMVLDEFNSACNNVTEDFNGFLERLQSRGRIPEAPLDTKPFKLAPPLDWESPLTPFNTFEVEAKGFTLWWPELAPETGNMMSGRPTGKPEPTDLRVRVQAEVGTDYSAITFFIDAGKPWDKDPVYTLSEAVSEYQGSRRETIFKHIENIRAICEGRLEAEDQQERRLIDLDLLPEPHPICGIAVPALELGYMNQAEALKAAADYLYKDLWKRFYDDFNFNLCDIAGDTDEVFANFRGLVMSTCGATVKDEKLLKAEMPPVPSLTSTPGSISFPRFDGEGEGYGSNKPEPNAVVKAFMPFMRRFRPEADWRDWIASGIFDWRAIYITAVGAQSEFAAFDESGYDSQKKIPSNIPAGNLPERRKKTEGAAPKTQPECADYAQGRGVPSTPPPHDDLPAPFRFLLLTKFEPNRKQVGRMIERITSLGDRRLFALKNWSIIQNASVWINHYGRQLDKVYEQWIKATGDLEGKTRDELKLLNDAFWQPIQADISALTSPAREEAKATLARYGNNPRRACEELEQLANKFKDGNNWEPIEAFTKKHKDADNRAYRTIDGNNDADLATINQNAGRALVKITAGLDRLGSGAVGGLPYRIARSRYYAETYHETVKNLRVGNIETWWSYEQFARRGMAPVLRHIASVGERMAKLRERLQAVKQDILQSSIASQTEATRDNTHRLERIQAEIRGTRDEAHETNLNLVKLQEMAANAELDSALLKKQAAEKDATSASWRRWNTITGFIIALIAGIILIINRLGP